MPLTNFDKIFWRGAMYDCPRTDKILVAIQLVLSYG